MLKAEAKAKVEEDKKIGKACHKVKKISLDEG